jgi:WD40 repeat protein
MHFLRNALTVVCLAAILALSATSVMTRVSATRTGALTAVPGGVNGGLIALTLRDQNGRLQIFTITPDGTNRKQLTFEGDNGRPDWSPDGCKIAFSSIRNGKAWVAAMDADGSNQKLLAEGFAPDWGPDGRQIAFSRPDDRQISQIWVVNADGTNTRQITQRNTNKIAPSWSPDGKQMVFILLMETQTLAALYSFFEIRKLFPDTDSREPFCLLTITGGDRPVESSAEFVFFAESVEDLHVEQRHFTLSAEDIALLNPNTRTCPVFRTKHDAELTKAIYRRVPVLIREGNAKGAADVNPWGIRFMAMLHMANDSGLFRTREDLLKEGWRLSGNIFSKDDEATCRFAKPRCYIISRIVTAITRTSRRIRKTPRCPMCR